MINTNQFDRGVLQRYQDSYLTKYRQARHLSQKMSVNNGRAIYLPQVNQCPDDLSWARFISIMEYEIDYLGTPLTNIPREIHHHAYEAIRQARDAYRVDRNLNWQGSTPQDVYEYFKEIPDYIFNSRAGVVIKLAEVELDKGLEVRKFFESWKKSLIDDLQEANSDFKKLPPHPQKSSSEIHAYENLLDGAVCSLEGELGMLTKIFPR